MGGSPHVPRERQYRKSSPHGIRSKGDRVIVREGVEVKAGASESMVKVTMVHVALESQAPWTHSPGHHDLRHTGSEGTAWGRRKSQCGPRRHSQNSGPSLKDVRVQLFDSTKIAELEWATPFSRCDRGGRWCLC